MKLCGVTTSDLGEQGDDSGNFLSPDASASGVNMNSFISNNELDSLRMDEEVHSNGIVIDDANAPCVSPDEVVEETGEPNRTTPSGSESQDYQDMDIQTDRHADRTHSAREPVVINSIFSEAALYRTAKPVIDELQKVILNLMHAGYKKAINPENKWGPDRSKQFTNHVFARIETLLGVSNAESTSDIDGSMIDSAVSYVSSLQTSGTNFTANEYVRVHILESLIVPNISNRTLATRLGVNRKLLPDMIEKRKKFDEIAALKKELNTVSADTEDDQSLEQNAEDFAAGLGADQLGILHMFSAFNFDQEDDFFLKAMLSQ